MSKEEMHRAKTYGLSTIVSRLQIIALVNKTSIGNRNSLR